MNEQIPFVYAQLSALTFVLLCIYLFVTRKSVNMCKPDLLITVGYVEQKSPATVKAEINFEDSFFEDCKDALVAIGFKKQQAKDKAREIFSKGRPESIQTFLSRALS